MKVPVTGFSLAQSTPLATQVWVFQRQLGYNQ